MSKSLPPIRRRVARVLLHAVLIWWVLERTARWGLIRRFFHREKSGIDLTNTRRTVLTLIQPILSGDPHLADTLRANATLEISVAVRWKWLVDEDDLAGRQLTDALLAELAVAAPHARRRVERILAPPAPDGVNPKTYKLRLAWERRASDEKDGFFGVLDDDTRLLPGQLERAADSLDGDPRVGLVFGLPYYRSFDTPWAALVSTFVNRNSLWSYLPILAVMPPPTINGMFWLARPEAVAALDGFRAVEDSICDDHAVARGVRAAGYELRQTAIVHPLRTGIADGRAYDRLITRWFIFPQVSLLRHEPVRRDGGILRAGVPADIPVPRGVRALAAADWRPVGQRSRQCSRRRDGARCFKINLERRISARCGGMRPGILATASVGLGGRSTACRSRSCGRCLAPRVIEWRGHRLRLDPDGRFEYLQRRGNP